ncbi:MAG: efflux RND transporter periplasmic adaptor subunit [Gammaproteobacteria bacterium]|nr:efflux RND transporter periplasmic adaptor subunit [Gammaproteobacteria bacterium]NNK99704.1 efflux RND transporter periplasmic adaptor subunit [Xanthomonadales bacterium]
MRLIRILFVCLCLPALSWAQAGINVRAQTLGEVLVDFERRAPAEVKALNDSSISAEVSAVVQSVHADVGKVVEKGELLLELNKNDYRLNLEQAEANLASSQARLDQALAKLNRAQKLGDKQYISADELLERETDVMVSQAQIQVNEVAVAIARRNLDKCSLRAPFDGVVVERMAQVGSFVRNGDPLLAVTQVDQFELDAEIPDSQADELLNTDFLHFESRGESWPVELLRLSPVIDAQARTRKARFTFGGAAPAVGRSGELVWRVGAGMLPANLISRRDGILGVFLLDGGKSRFEPLPDAQEGRPVRVNLPAGTQVITMGRERLQDGVAVSVQ